jgi:putative zinc finger/helix-turn-helix YgiT family protein
MKSPITGKEMVLYREKRSVSFRKESFDMMFHCYICEESGESFTTTGLDEINMLQVHGLYRSKHNLPFPEDIKQIRNKYGLAASKMSEILGLGINTYRSYESGEMPTVSNARLIQLADDEEEFLKLVELCETISMPARESIISKATKLIQEKHRQVKEKVILEYIFGKPFIGRCTGFNKPSIKKTTEMVVFFAEKMQPYKTKLNKLLFYADFLMFSQSVRSISGLRYRAIDMGPVPENYDSLYEYIRNQGAIETERMVFPEGHTGERFIPAADHPFNPEMFSEAELSVLKFVYTKFANSTAKEMVEISHREKAWISNHQNRDTIDYAHSFELNVMM